MAGACALSAALDQSVSRVRRPVELATSGTPLAPPHPVGSYRLPDTGNLTLGHRQGARYFLRGGGEWFTFWTLAYCMEAKNHGVDFENVDLTIGTSAGSIVGSFVSSATVSEAYSRLALAADPDVLARMVVTNTGAPSQQRATEVLGSATSTDYQSLLEIGRAAMAARNTPVATYTAALTKLLGARPGRAPSTTPPQSTVGTTELVVVSSDSGIDIATACAASSSLPGVNGPVWLGDHHCMDGGVSPSSTHSDILAGAQRVIIFSYSVRRHRPAPSGWRCG